MLSGIAVLFSFAPNVALCSDGQFFFVFHKLAFAAFGTRMSAQWRVGHILLFESSFLKIVTV